MSDYSRGLLPFAAIKANVKVKFSPNSGKLNHHANSACLSSYNIVIIRIYRKKRRIEKDGLFFFSVRLFDAPNRALEN
jgi:hypothetical protein